MKFTFKGELFKTHKLIKLISFPHLGGRIHEQHGRLKTWMFYWWHREIQRNLD